MKRMDNNRSICDSCGSKAPELMPDDSIFPREDVFGVPEGFFANEIKRLQVMAKSAGVSRRSRRAVLRNWIVGSSVAAAAAVCAVVVMDSSEDIAPQQTVSVNPQVAAASVNNHTEKTYTDRAVVSSDVYADDLYDADVFMWLY